MRETPQEWGITKKGGGREKKEKTAVVCMVLENHENLVLKVEEEEYQAPRTKHPGTTFQA